MNSFTSSVTSCARCGLNHLNLEAVVFTAFQRPPSDATHWGTCPTTGEPILMRVGIIPVLASDDKALIQRLCEQQLTNDSLP